MNKERILILDKDRIGRKLKRMAYQIWENNSDAEAVTLVSINGGGDIVAENLKSILESISPLKVEHVIVKLNKRKPIAEDIALEKDLSGKSLVLVDDVANSGKTLMYALKPLLGFDLKKVLIAVLVDRRHKSFPITPDIIGHSVATTLQEHIEVETAGNTVTAAYLQ
jgi:pyrimidine operon attenuation protein/uracil phosphoribosyltransferase